MAIFLTMTRQPRADYAPCWRNWRSFTFYFTFTFLFARY